jgi:hypothetical protein
MEYDYENIDLTKIYNYKDLPDKQSGRCDQCHHSHFKSTAKEGKFLRECRNCGMKKLI